MVTNVVLYFFTGLRCKTFRMKKLTTDEVLEKIGSFGRYQIVLNIFFNLCYAFWWSIPVMGAIFIAAEPGWRCKNNATCPFTETISLGDDKYSYRCDIPREDWEFTNDFTSVVTEVCPVTSMFTKWL